VNSFRVIGLELENVSELLGLELVNSFGVIRLEFVNLLELLGWS